ncbi:MAG: ATP-binding protein [Candidatus Eisenbacteria bacterium]
MNRQNVAPASHPAALFELRQSLDEAYSPTAPVTRRDLFAGRHRQLQALIQVMAHPGQHAVLFGERGVGKTSLVSMLAKFTAARFSVIRVSAAANDEFTTLWRKVAACLTGSSPLPSGQGDPLTPQGAVGLLSSLGADEPLVVIIDEFDCIVSPRVRALMADTLRVLSDQADHVTVVLVGVADDVPSLIHAHPCVDRAVVPVHLPRMAHAELSEACSRSLVVAGMSAELLVIQRIATLSQGLPHFTHLLGRGAACIAGQEHQSHITLAHLDASVAVAIGHASENVRLAYEQSIVRARRGIYPEILLAAVLSERDDHGAFSVAAVRDMLERIVRREVRGLTNQIAALSEAGRGGALQKFGAGMTARFRFVNPSLEPFILMRGLEQGWATAGTPVWLPSMPQLVPMPSHQGKAA